MSPDRYFAEERRGAALFIVAGLAAVTLSLVLAARPTAYRGMIPPLALFGLIEIAVGGTVFRRDPPAGADARAGERERMRRVLASFRVYKVAEIVVLTAGLTLMMLFPRW